MSYCRLGSSLILTLLTNQEPSEEVISIVERLHNLGIRILVLSSSLNRTNELYRLASSPKKVSNLKLINGELLGSEK